MKEKATKISLIGLAGGSCSGKSTLCAYLKPILQNSSFLSFDEFFVGLEALKNTDVTDWESPTLYRFAEFIASLDKLKLGERVVIKPHSRESTKKGINSMTIEPRPKTIIDGFLIYSSEGSARRFDIKFYLDIPEEVMVERRLARITTNAGWDNKDYILNELIQGHRKYVVPQKKKADYILDGLLPTNNIANIMLAVINP